MQTFPQSVFSEALKFLCRSSENGGIYGLKGSAAAFFIAMAVKRSSNKILWVHPDDDSASMSASNLSFYLGLDEKNSNSVDFPIVHYPETLSIPYSLAGFESEIWTERMSCLSRLRSQKVPKIITISIPSLCRKIIPRVEFDSLSHNLCVGQEIDRDSICFNLVNGGYSRAPLVEDVGDFAARGSILDIYSPLYTNPVRIEQMGDVIESMRFLIPQISVHWVGYQR